MSKQLPSIAELWIFLGTCILGTGCTDSAKMFGKISSASYFSSADKSSTPKLSPAPNSTPFPIVAKSKPCGLIDDGAVHVAPNYENFSFPQKGSSYVDPAFGCSVTRISDGLKDGLGEMHHEYGPIRALNSDNSKVLFQAAGGGWGVISVQGNLIVSPTGLGLARWNPRDPNSLFMTSGNQIFRLDIVNGAFSKSVLHTFPEYTSVTFGNHADLGEDGTYAGIIGRLPNSSEIFAYNLISDVKGTVKTMGVYDGHASEPEITPGNKIFVDNALYDLSFNLILTLPSTFPTGSHHIIGKDIAGKDMIALTTASATFPFCSTGNGIAKFDLTTGTPTCLLQIPWWGDSSHFSLSRNGWLLSSITDYNDNETAMMILPANWQSFWRPIMNELLLIKTDGTEVRHLAHHRSRPKGVGTFQGGSYWSIPRASISADGAYAIFDSNMGLANTDPDFTDIFMVKIVP